VLSVVLPAVSKWTKLYINIYAEADNHPQNEVTVPIAFKKSEKEECAFFEGLLKAIYNYVISTQKLGRYHMYD
jgi:hypothetical protein